MRLNEARRWADETAKLLAPACARILVCGSVRREKAEVKDVEIVCIESAAHQRPVFGEAATALSPLNALLDRLLRFGELKVNSANPKWGAKYKTLRHPRGGVGIDLFIVTPQNWGNLCVIRTGDADFSRILVTKQSLGGCMPDHLAQRDGFMYGLDGPIPCPEEANFFRLLGLDEVPDPRDRTFATAQRLARQIRATGGV